MKPKNTVKVIKLKKKYAIILVIALLGIFALVLGTSYAFFTNTVNGKEYIVYSGTLEIEYEKKTSVINIPNATPMDNTSGLATTPYSFDVKNNGTLATKYQVRLEQDPSNTLPLEYVKISVYKNDVEYLKPTKLSNLNANLVIVDDGLLQGMTNNTPTTDNYKVRLWVDLGAGNDVVGKEFKGRVVIDAMQNVEDGFDVNTAPIITLNKDSNNNTHINLIKGDTFTDPGVESVKDDTDVLKKSNITTTYEYYDGTNLTTVDSIDTNTTGIYYVTYSIADSKNLEGKTVRVVTVNNGGTIPTITLNGSNMSIAEGDTFVDPGVTTTVQVITIGEVKTTTPGIYTLRYIAIDENNNMNSVVRTVTVVAKYREGVLAGTYPVLTDNLVPVTIDSDGTVHKADLTSNWYSYQNKNWANAVVLVDDTVTYANDATIPESNIESYFVWIPKYSYQLWDLGNYNGLSTLQNKAQTINIKFGATNTQDSNNGECTTPMTSGTSGNCQVGDYMTHPAFISMDVNGLWVGKFETGYKGATTSDEAQVNSSDSSKIIIKPNVYSWRNITVGNMFSASYNYIRDLDSHMMKNTEWGAVAYLGHSAYGSATSVRVNNNSDYITGYAATEEPTVGYKGSSIDGNRFESTTLGASGTYTKPYNTSVGYTASTTGNITGVYDMSGGALDYVMGYTTGASTVGGASNITTIYPDFLTNSSWSKYYDKYTSTSTAWTEYNNRILGDATGEMGPFQSTSDPDGKSRYKSSWYQDYAYFVGSSRPWFLRGDTYNDGVEAGSFAFVRDTDGAAAADLSYRIVLAPTE